MSKRKVYSTHTQLQTELPINSIRGEELKRVMEAYRKTVDDLVEATGLGISTIKNLRKNNRGRFSVYTILSLEKGLRKWTVTEAELIRVGVLLPRPDDGAKQHLIPDKLLRYCVGVEEPAVPWETPSKEGDSTPSFWIWKRPVTIGEFKALDDENGFHGPTDAEWEVNVSWNDAQGFCEQLTKLLQNAYGFSGSVALPMKKQYEVCQQKKIELIGDGDRIIWEWCADHKDLAVNADCRRRHLYFRRPGRPAAFDEELLTAKRSYIGFRFLLLPPMRTDPSHSRAE